jgi:hypothetical protein
MPTIESVRATGLVVTDDELIVSLIDGRQLSVPLVWFPRLLHATPSERADFRWIGDGLGIHWTQLDEDLSVAGLLHGTKAPAVSPAGSNKSSNEGIS